MKKLLVFILLFLIFNMTFQTPVQAIYDPTSVPNNKFGIHIISATPDEFNPAQTLVNTNGDWGYITLLIETKDRNHNKWQTVFNDLRRRHLIPIVRMATEPNGGYWKRPLENDEVAWAEFLNSLNWPTKNRYVIVYNEPNHAQEWGNSVDAADYAKTLDKTITALKSKSDDFFILNAGFDASAPQKLPAYQDQAEFMQQMHEAVPGIFDRIDGWNSHSYPNPGFISSPDATGRGTVRTYLWELEQLPQLGVKKELPVFITETGWMHSDGMKKKTAYPSPEKVSGYYQKAFENAWNNNRIVAVTPFILNYQSAPFDHFSFKKMNGSVPQNPSHLEIGKVLGVETDNPDYHPQYQIIKNLSKTTGKPIQETKAELTKGKIFSSIVAGEQYTLQLVFKNTGQSIWNDPNTPPVKLAILEGGEALGLNDVSIPETTTVEPNGEHIFTLSLKAPDSGSYIVRLNLKRGDKVFDTKDLEFTTIVKSPVTLKIKSSLEWRDNFSGNYMLTMLGTMANNIRQSTKTFVIGKDGTSKNMEAKYLLPDTEYDFTLERAYYKPKTIKQTVVEGENELDFGELQFDVQSAILNPTGLWEFLPFNKK